MQSLRYLRRHDRKIVLWATAGAVSLYAVKPDSQGPSPVPSSSSTTTWCEQPPPPQPKTEAGRFTRPSWIRRTLGYLKASSLPIPRLIVRGDPVFRMDPKLLQKRQDDEVVMQYLVRSAVEGGQARDPKALQELNDKCLALAYGDGVTMKSRQDFVHVSFVAEQNRSTVPCLSLSHIYLCTVETRMYCLDRPSLGCYCGIRKGTRGGGNWSR